MGLENVVDLVFFMTVFPQLVESQLLQPCLNPFFTILERKKKKKILTLFESMLVLRVFTFTYMLWLISLIILKFP